MVLGSVYFGLLCFDKYMPSRPAPVHAAESRQHHSSKYTCCYHPGIGGAASALTAVCSAAVCVTATVSDYEGAKQMLELAHT